MTYLNQAQCGDTEHASEVKQLQQLALHFLLPQFVSYVLLDLLLQSNVVNRFGYIGHSNMKEQTNLNLPNF